MEKIVCTFCNMICLLKEKTCSFKCPKCGKNNHVKCCNKNIIYLVFMNYTEDYLNYKKCVAAYRNEDKAKEYISRQMDSMNFYIEPIELL